MSSAERTALEQLEHTLQAGERDGALAALAWLGALEVDYDEALVHGARRRAVLLLAAGGDPRRGLTFEDRAVGSLAAELESALPRGALGPELERLGRDARDLPLVSGALAELASDDSLALRALACALLAEELELDEE